MLWTPVAGALALALAWGTPAPLNLEVAPEAVGSEAGTAPIVGTHVPWADGGLHQMPDGSLSDEPEQWPKAQVPTIRLWDTRTTWAHLEPVDDSFTFATLDAHLEIAERQGVDDVLLVLAGTPAWAAQEPESAGAPWLPKGAASPPSDLEEWREFVEVVATRYRGRISAYQIGNEPNLEWFWQGSPEELAEATRVAAEVIRGADPDALVVTAGPIVTDLASVETARPWWEALSDVAVDVDAVQWYPRFRASPSDLMAIVAAIREATFSGRPLWLTEVNHAVTKSVTAKQQRQLVRRTMRSAQQAGVERVYWYAWSQLVSPRLMVLQNDSPAGRQLRKWWRTHNAP